MKRKSRLPVPPTTQPTGSSMGNLAGVPRVGQGRSPVLLRSALTILAASHGRKDHQFRRAVRRGTGWCCLCAFSFSGCRTLRITEGCASKHPHNPGNQHHEIDHQVRRALRSGTGRSAPVSLQRFISTAATVCLALVTLQMPAIAQSAQSQSPVPTAPRDGSHEFDFEFGLWKTHLRRLTQPLSGSDKWVEYDGTTKVTPVWGGRANLIELDADGPAGHITALNLRLYNPAAHQWSLNFASVRSGTIGVPTVGEFKNGVGEFYDQEDFDGRSIFVRLIITPINADEIKF